MKEAAKKTTKKAAKNVKSSPVTTLAGLALGALELYTQGVSPKSVGIATAATLLGAILKDPSIFTRKK
jgi:hypothetical protein